MCQVYYVRGFFELIYFVAVSFNQGQFMHIGWPIQLGGGGWGGGIYCSITSLREQYHNKNNSAGGASLCDSVCVISHCMTLSIKLKLWNPTVPTFLLCFHSLLGSLYYSHTLTHILKCWEVPQCCGHHHHHHHQLSSCPFGDCIQTVDVSVHRPLSWALAPVLVLALSCRSEGWCTPWRSQWTYSTWHLGPGGCQSGVTH